LIIANSRAVRADVLRQEHLPESKVIVIHNGVGRGRTTPLRSGETRRSLSIADDAPLVAVLANLIHYKGHATFLAAWKRVLSGCPTAVALLVGDGVMRLEVEQLVHELELDESVRILGSRSDVAELLEAIDLLVHPSLQEGFSNAILEAMAAGKPVVATTVGGNPEAVVHGVTGLLVPPGDSEAMAVAISRLLKDVAARSEFGAAGQRRVLEHFDLGKMVKSYERVYAGVVRGPVVPTLHDDGSGAAAAK